MKKMLGMFVVTVLLLGTMAYSVFAYGMMQGNGNANGRERGMACGGGNAVAMNGLSLTAEQQEKVLTIRQQFQKETLNLRQELQRKSWELNQLWQAQPANQTAIENKNKEVTGLQVQLNNKRLNMVEKLNAVLTPEQQKLAASVTGCQGGGCGRGRGGYGCGGGL